MKRKFLAIFLSVAAVLTLTACTAEEPEIIPQKPDDYVSVDTPASTSTTVSSSASVEEQASSAIVDYQSQDHLEDGLPLFDMYSYLEVDISISATNSSGMVNGGWYYIGTEKERYLLGSNNITKSNKASMKNTTPAYYIDENGAWTKYTEGKTAWESTRVYDNRASLYEVLKSMTYSKIKEAEISDEKIFINGHYDLSEYSEILSGYYEGFDISKYDLSNLDIQIVENSDGAVKKIEFYTENEDGYLKFTIAVKNVNTQKKLKDKPF